MSVPDGARVLLASHNAGKLAELRRILVEAVPGLEPEQGFSSAGVELPDGVEDHGDDAANHALPLAQLADIPDAHRGARFVCAAALVSPDGRELVERGEMVGRLLHEARGEGGFGYDPLFVPDGEQRTSAELSPAEKDAISHRGRAFRAIAPHVAELLTL